jgi:hypothetical protein
LFVLQETRLTAARKKQFAAEIEAMKGKVNPLPVYIERQLFSHGVAEALQGYTK